MHISEPNKHLGWSFFCDTNEELKAINYLCKKDPSDIFGKVVKTPLKFYQTLTKNFVS